MPSPVIGQTQGFTELAADGGPSQHFALFRWFWARDLHERDRGPHDVEPRVFQNRGLAVRFAGPV